MTHAKRLFTPVSYPGRAPFEPTVCYPIAFGLVVHPALDMGPHAKRGFWDVSDPETGALVAFGLYPGRPGAIAAAVKLAIRYKQAPAGFRGAIERARIKLRRQLESIKPIYRQP